MLIDPADAYGWGVGPNHNDQWTTAVQAFIAVIVIAGAFVVQMVHGVIPEWLSLSVGAVMGFYFATNRQQVQAIAQRTADVVRAGLNNGGPSSGGSGGAAPPSSGGPAS